MGLKKYEIIKVGHDKRVRALRSWQVQDRYVNIGDVGGIVYDEKTLSQDGACWLFRGNFNFPGARIGGDSVVDVGEATIAAAGSANIDILGSSVVVGSAIRFSVINGAADATVLRPTDFEAGTFDYTAGSNWETWKQPSSNYLRTKAPIFNGGASTTVLKLEVPGYTVLAYVLDRDGKGVTATAPTNTGVGVTLAIPAGQYFLIQLSKNPVTTISLSEVTTAAITYTALYDGKLVINDSRLEINPATGTGTLTLRPGGTYPVAVGSKYPDSVIQNSRVSILGHATANRTVTLMSEFIDTNAIIDASVELATAIVGVYSSVKNLTFSGSVTGSTEISVRGVIQATDCDNFAVSPTIFPGLAAAQTANMPFIFQGCNVPNGRFYHHVQIANTYKNIDFALAQADLGITLGGSRAVASSEVEGMYRLVTPVSGLIGGLIESFASVEKLIFSNFATIYDTTIYADAYFNGFFDIRGTNVFGNTMKHEASNTQNVMAVRGVFNATRVGGTITGIVDSATLVCIPTPFRINGGKGLTISNLPAGFEAVMFMVDANNVITRVQSTTMANTDLETDALVDCNAYILFRKTAGTVTPEEVAGVTVTTYNGCKLVNTKATAATIAGNVRVEDNATLIDTSVTGTGYFGGNSIIQAPSALVGQLPIEGAAYMSDNAVFAPTVANASARLSLLEMKDNAVFAGQLAGASTNYNITMANNAQFLGIHNSHSGFVMRGNSFVAAAGAVASACRGLLILKDDARVESNSLTAIGYITLCGKYRQTANKVWTGKRVIDSQDAPEYDNNVKTQYDF